MKNAPFFPLRFRYLAAVFSSAVLLAHADAHAQGTFTWTGGGGDNNWTTGGNWGGTAPGSPQNNLHFTGSTRLNTTNTFAAFASGFRIFFDSGAGSFSINSNAIKFFDFGGNTPRIENDSTNAQTINVRIGAGNSAGLDLNPNNGDLIINPDASNAKIFLDGGSQLRVTGANGKTVFFNAAIQDGNQQGTFAITANSTAVFSNTNTMTGATFVSAGTLRLAVSGSDNNSTIDLGDTTGSANATLSSDNGITSASPLVVRSGSSGLKTISNTTNGSGPATFTGGISLAMDVTTFANTNGPLTFTGNVDYQNPNPASGVARKITVSGSGDTAFSGSFTNAATGSSVLTKTNSGTLSLLNTNAIRVLYNHGGGVISITNAGAIGIPINANYPDKFNFTANATLRATNSFTLGSNVSSTNNAGFRIAGGVTGTFEVQGNSTLTLDGVVSEFGGGSGNLTKIGNGTLILQQTNTYTGTNTISAGTLKTVVPGATGSGPVLIGAGGTLTGPGTVNGSVTIAGTIAPGNSPGSLATGSEVWTNGGHYTWEINSANGTTGSDPGYDQLTVNGSLSILASNGGFTIDITGLNLSDVSGSVNGFVNTSNYTWTILHTTGGITGFSTGAFTLNSSPFSNNNALAGGAFTITLANSGNDLVLNYVTPPSVVSSPSSQTVSYGGIANFSVSAIGTAPLNYQWRVGGLNISGATASTYSLSPVHLSDGAAYDVVVSNSVGSTTSAVATLAVNPATLTVTASNQSRIYGATNPILTYSISGFVAGESLGTSDVSGTPAITTTADSNSTVAGSPYTITAAIGTLASTNYTFTFANASLTVTPASSSLALAPSANPSPTGSNVTFTATVTTVAPSHGVPAGSVQFLTNGVAVGSPVPLTSSTAALSLSGLPHATNTVSALFTSDGNYFASSNSLSEIINTVPVAGLASYERPRDLTFKITISDLLTNASDADMDTLSLFSVSPTSTNGATITTNSTNVLYNPPSTNANVTDTFNYTVIDPFGATNMGTVLLTIAADANEPSVNITGISPLPDGNQHIDFAGIPNRSYLIQATTDLTPPITWTTLSTNTAATNGLFSFDDLNATNYPTRFYRTATP